MNLPAVVLLSTLFLSLALMGCAFDPNAAAAMTPGDPGHPGVVNSQAAPVPPFASRPQPPSSPDSGPSSTLGGYGDPTTQEPSR